MTGLTDGMTAVVFDFYATLTPSSPAEAWARNARALAAVLGVEDALLVRVLDDSFPERITGALGDARATMLAIAARLGVALSPARGRHRSTSDRP
jgi:putative hydrolase of the HAD superfamily